MKRIGLIGGVSPESTALYYQDINLKIRNRLGGYNNAHMIIHSVNFAEYNTAHLAEDWDFIRSGFVDATKGLDASGADIIALACNTLHTVADAITSATDKPFLHIVDCCADRLIQANRRRPALLGTAFTMQDHYFSDRLMEIAQLPVLLPDLEVQTELSRIIFEELTIGVVKPESISFYVETVRDLADKGADSVILGCTELGMLLNDENCPLPSYNTAQIHCDAIVEAALA